ncbi:MAG: 50S ribosomal protein L9 [Patescibacteria group bacterium]
MRIILLQDVPKIGRKYDIKDVSSGYARNFLFPRGLAELATSDKIKLSETKRKQTEQEMAIQDNILGKNINILEGLTIEVKEKSNEKGHLFAGIHKKEISKILREKNHIDIPAELIEIGKPIKEIGKHKIKVKDKEFILNII